MTRKICSWTLEFYYEITIIGLCLFFIGATVSASADARTAFTLQFQPIVADAGRVEKCDSTRPCELSKSVLNSVQTKKIVM
jgi:hypothetical protein